MIPIWLQTATSLVVNQTVAAPSVLMQILTTVGALVLTVLGVISPYLIMAARIKAKQLTDDLQRANARAEESGRVASVAVRGVEIATARLTPSEAKATKNEIQALSDVAGVKDALATVVEGNGLAKSKTQPERPAAQEDKS